MSTSTSTSSISVIGAGAWGTALAQIQARAGRKVTLWAREAEVVESINTRHENTLYLKGVVLHENVRATAQFADCLSADTILLVTPAQHLRSTLNALGPEKLAGKTVVLCAKGIEIETGRLLSDIVAETAPLAECAVLSGPCFAREIALSLPSAATLAASTMDKARALSAAISTPTFRTYASDDVKGAEIGGAVKNVIAIACGVVHGRGLGDSARAALLTRGMVEIMRLAAALGARRETLFGMCGLGDLMLTASSLQSRNYSLGFALGEGKSAEEILGERIAVTEGVPTAKAVVRLAASLGVDMPIVQAVYAMVYDHVPVERVMQDLLSRPLIDE